ncbi:MAG: hypothetical protein J1E42_02130 [Akkermansiaceae bacterium]|nr:hypothetical protein [Akkermansiaceae bacterium]
MPAAPRHHANPRQLALQCLQRWEEGGIFAETLIQKSAQGLNSADRALLQAIVLGTLRHLRRLEHILHTLRGRRPTQAEPRRLLLCGLCQLIVLHMPGYAVVNEMVNLAPPRVRGLVNGVLRQAIRRAAEWEAELGQLPPGVRYSMPDWLVERWLARWGEPECCALLESMSRPAAVCVRTNTLKPLPAIPADWLPVPGAPGWYKLTGSGLPLEAIHAGQVYVADPSTRYSLELLAPRAGERVLDTCAAPGGKSAGILSATRGECSLLATDAEAHRLPTLRENLLRAGAAQARVEQHDWTHPCPEAWRGAFDAVLVDAPCSNSGVFGRRVDARWRLTPKELKKLCRTQLTILQHALQALRPGGRLVYSTCSIEEEEDRGIVQELLNRHPELELEREILALPHREQADGAYAALLRLPSRQATSTHSS